MILNANEMIAAAKAHCDCLDAAGVQQYCKQHADVLIIDVREPHEHERSSLPDTINIPRGLLEMRIGEACPDPDRPILVHCGAGGRASLSAHTLQTMGYSNVHVADADFSELLATFGVNAE